MDARSKITWDLDKLKKKSNNSFPFDLLMIDRCADQLFKLKQTNKSCNYFGPHLIEFHLNKTEMHRLNANPVLLFGQL